MGLFKEVRKPVIRSVVAGASEISPLRPRFVPKAPPCASACPNGSEIRELMVSIAKAKDYGFTREQAFERVWNRIVERNPFPAVTGRICPHPCESACNRGAKDGPVAFNAIERMIGDFGIAHKLRLPRFAVRPRVEKVAIIGAGPAGLSCAYQLIRRGYAVTVFEALHQPGGMLRYGIPEFRLPREVLNAEIGRILDLGVELKCNCAVGKGISLQQLRRDFAAVFTGIGAHKGIELELPGDDAPNVLSGIGFLKNVLAGQKPDLGDKVVVVGAGGTACDAARLSKRLGADVSLVGLELTAPRSEIERAREEGVRIEYPAVPLQILRQNGHAAGVRFIRVRPQPTADDTSHAVPIAGSEFDLEASSVIVAVRQQPDFRGLETLANGNGWMKIDDWGRTTTDGIFAGGDSAGLGIATGAISQGRIAAEAIEARFQGRALEKPPALAVIPIEKLKLDWYPAAPRHDAQRTSVAGRELGAEVDCGLTEDEVMEEAQRCMSCGMCMDCETCWMYCSNNCFVRLPKGEHCMIKLEICNGCKKCAEACPSGYIEMN
ncbi:MAG: NAD(P)-binding protein [Terriglobales bacterium]|jgi:NADPH-dependent glutamate synthase beta subunit-like oxidoreductase/Pyruvate/2-oxoacid:ferredoxin oxidoreductase delta subunit